MTKEQTATASPKYPTLEALFSESMKFVKSMGEATAATIQDASDLMMIKIDEDTRKRLDALVEVGLVENRREAAQLLLREGLKNHTEIFERIDKTKTKIADLRQQMREIGRE